MARAAKVEIFVRFAMPAGLRLFKFCNYLTLFVITKNGWFRGSGVLFGLVCLVGLVGLVCFFCLFF